MRPLVVIEGHDPGAERFEAATARALGEGWTIVDGWSDTRPGERLVCSGTVATADDARAALLAALSGRGVIVWATAERSTIDMLLDDLRRLGRVEHLPEGVHPPARLDTEQRLLLDLLADGLTLGEAALQLGLARRTADRRLAAARRVLGVATTAEAILASRDRHAPSALGRSEGRVAPTAAVPR